MNKNTLKVGDKFHYCGIECEVVLVGNFGGTEHYGLNWKQPDQFMKVAGWIPCYLLDAHIEIEAQHAAEK